MCYDLFQWMDFWANVAVVGAFIFTGITFWVTFKRNRKDEELKTVWQVSDRISESEEALMNELEEMKNTPVSKEDLKTRTYNFEQIRKLVIDHFNNWEWFALLVNSKELSEGIFLNHLRGNFIEDYDRILSKFPDLYKKEDEFPECFKLYKNIKKST